MIAVLDHLRGRGFKDRLLNPHDELWDRWLRVRTFGFHPASGQPDDDWRLHYTPVPYRDIFRFLRLVDLGGDDVFTDLGSGMGRAVFAASWMGACRAVGVEIVEHLCAKAKENHRRSRLARRDIEFICEHAAHCRLGDTTVLFIFHSFGEATLRQVLLNIEAERSQQAAPARLRIIYMNPVFDAVLQQTPWLECIGRVPPTTLWLSTARRYLTTLWRSVDSA